VEDKIENRPPSPETAPFFIFVHRLLPQKTKENPCKKKKEGKIADQSTHTCNAISTIAITTFPDPCNGRTPGIRVLATY
jgi:hypothetical protein